MSEPTPLAQILQTRADRPVERHGDVVRRRRQPWSGAVHALLTHLREVGFTEAPQPLLLSETVEEEAFIPGVSGDDACALVATDEAVAEVGSLLRRYHDAVASWHPAEAPVWFDGRSGVGDGTTTLVCHGDPGPWNLVWREGRIVGLIDWEYATVASPHRDIAYALHYLAPLRDRSYWTGVLAMSRRPRRRHRMAVFAEAYGIPLTEQLVVDVLAAQQAGADFMLQLAERGHARQIQQIADGDLDRERTMIAWAESRRRRFLPR